MRQKTPSPSIKTLEKEFKITKVAATMIKRAMINEPPYKALKIANDVLGECGVESLYPEFPNFEFVNTGETYEKTLYFTGKSFQIGSWGDWVERHARWMK